MLGFRLVANIDVPVRLITVENTNDNIKSQRSFQVDKPALLRPSLFYDFLSTLYSSNILQ